MSMVVEPDILTKEIEALRTRALFDEGGGMVLSPIAEQHFLQALALLDAAQRAMQLAAYHQMRDM